MYGIQFLLIRDTFVSTEYSINFVNWKFSINFKKIRARHLFYYHVLWLIILLIFFSVLKAKIKNIQLEIFWKNAHYAQRSFNISKEDTYKNPDSYILP